MLSRIFQAASASLLFLIGVASHGMADPVSLPVQITAPGDGLASVAVYNDKNEMIRSLAYALPVKAGAQSLTWDGTTDLGLPADPGAYHVHGVFFTQPPQIKYIMKVGLSGEPPYLSDEPNSGWGACHGPATAICANSKNLLAIFNVSESPRESGIQLMDLNGKIVSRFTSFYAFDRRKACVMDDKNIYLAIHNAGYGGKGLVIGKYDINNPPRGKILCQVPVGDHIDPGPGSHQGQWTTDCQGLALQNGRLYVSALLDDKVFVIDSESGQVIGTGSVPSPRGLATHDGKIYAVSGKTVVALDADGNPDKTPIISGLDDPGGLAMDAAGNFYVADGGASQQVKVFSSTGQSVREIGLKGGRPRSGVFNPAGMLDPRGICVAPDGRIWVPEVADDFMVLSVWNPDGTKANAFYNTHWASGQGRLSPDMTEMYFDSRPGNDNSGLLSYKVDFDKGTWQPYYFIKQMPDMLDQRDVLLGIEPGTDKEKLRFNGHLPYLSFERDAVLGSNGKTYLLGGNYSIWIFDPETKTVKLASLICGSHVAKTPAGPYQASIQGESNWLTWADLNGDGKMSLDEVSYVEKPPLLDHAPKISQLALNPDLSVTMLVMTEQPKPAPATWALLRLVPTKVLPTGVPVYDWNKLEKVTDLHVPDFHGGDHDPERDSNRTGLGFMKLANDAVYLRLEPGTKAKLHLTGIDGDGWWASRNWRITPEKFDLKTGEPAWLKLGRRTPGHAKPGEMYYPGWGLAGTSHGVDFYADTLSQVWAWTDDGLYLGRVYDDVAGQTPYTENGVHVELIGSFIYDINGKTYILTGDHGVSVHEMTFPPMTPLDGGTLTLTPELAAQAKPWDPDGPTPGKRPIGILKSIFDFSKGVQKNTRTITIDGKLDPAEWSGAPAMDLNLDGKKVGTVQVTYDKTNLYLAYDVQDPNGLKNTGGELPLAPFVTGSYVDFTIGPDWATPNRPDNADGDVRVILARITGNSPADYQMGFWPIKQDLKRFSPKPRAMNPQDIVSPVAHKHFDDISPVAGLQFAYQVTDKGYTLEVEVPLAALGISPGRQPIVGFDASVAFSDSAGTSRDRAVHWAGDSEAAVVDRPGSAELKPETWGTMQFDPNPLPPVDSTAAK